MDTSTDVNVFGVLLDTIAYVQDTYKNRIDGSEKKRIVEVKIRMLLGDNPDYHAVKEYLPELIDVMVFLAKNKAITKLFKRDICKMCF